MSEPIYENCGICHEEISIVSPYTRQLSCIHNNIFHHHCITTWIERTWIETTIQLCCPYCRAAITLTEEQQQRRQQIRQQVYVRPVYDAETERLIEEARQLERNRIQNAIEERIRQIRTRV